MNEQQSGPRAIEAQIQSLESTLSQLASGEEDRPVAAFFSTLGNHLESEVVKDILTNTLTHRPALESEHLAYLLFISTQHVTKFGFDKFHNLDEKDRQTLLEKTLEEHGEKIVNLCETKNVSTNIVERYAGLQIILAMIARQDATVVDLGTSFGLGLMALNHPQSFEQIQVENEELRQLLTGALSLGLRIGIDQSPREFKDIQWLRACLLPGYRKNRIGFERALNRFLAGEDITYLHGNFLNPKKLTNESIADVVWTSNTLYMLSNDKRTAHILIKRSVEHLAKPDGVYVDADYRSWNLPFNAPDNPYVFTARFARNWEESYEVLQSSAISDDTPKDAVLTLEKGRDFEEFAARVQHQPID